MPSIKQPPLALLIVIAMASPLALNAFVPAMPTAMESLNVSQNLIQLSFTLYLLTLAIGQLVSGQLADTYGRRPIILGGFFLHLSGSLVAAAANSIEILLVGRVLQALGGGAAMTLVRTILIDMYGPKKSASRMGYLIMAIAISQAIAPALGGYLNVWFNWNAIFYFSGLTGSLVWLLAFKFLPETAAVNSKAQPISKLNSYRIILRSPVYLGYVLTTTFLALAFYLFVGSSPYVVTEQLGGNSATYGTWFLWVSGAFIVGGYASTLLAKILNDDQTIVLGNALALIGALLLVLLNWHNNLSFSGLFLPMALLVFGRGLSQPNAQLAAINACSQTAGTASGLMGFIQLLLGALVAQSVPYILQLGINWVMGSILLAVILSWLAHFFAWRAEQQHLIN